MASYRNPKGIIIRPTDTVEVLLDHNPKKGALNTVYWQAIIDAIAAGHSTVAAIRDFAKKDPRYAHVPILAEIRHNVGRGYYRLVRDDRPLATPELAESSPAHKAPPRQTVGFGDEPPAYEVRASKAVDTSNVREFGEGQQNVYVYGYDALPDRLKVGKAERDVVRRIASQINTGTPSKPALYLIFRTDDCHNLEKALHRVLSFRGRKVTGGGDEWFHTNCDELIEIYKLCLGSPPVSQ